MADGIEIEAEEEVEQLENEIVPDNQNKKKKRKKKKKDTQQ